MNCLIHKHSTLLSTLIPSFTNSLASLIKKFKKSSIDSGYLSVLIYKPTAKTNLDRKGTFIIEQSIGQNCCLELCANGNPSILKLKHISSTFFKH